MFQRFSPEKDCSPSSCNCNSAGMFPVQPPKEKVSCCGGTTGPANTEEDVPCCGGTPGPACSPFERPGYKVCSFVEDFIDTPAGTVPKVKTRLNSQDLMGTVSARTGIGRNDYKISPGLYAVGIPDADSPVLVTANYKLTFDALRKELDGIHCWIAVLDTRGVNVWCSAGKGTFSDSEVIERVQKTGLEKVVRHRKLILPQLSATGVSAQKVKKGCGFEVVWGPVRAGDIKPFLNAGMKAEKSMRRVTFSLRERTVLVPVEIYCVKKPMLWAILIILSLSGFGPGIFSLHSAWFRGLTGIMAVMSGIAAGAVITPILLPYIPGTAFSLKGAIAGTVSGILAGIWGWSRVGGLGALALLLLTAAVSSYLAMNFTGATPFTSPSGVEKEMRRAIPIQAGAMVIALIVWIASAFTG